MESAIIQYHYFKLIRVLEGEHIQEDLKISCIASRHFQHKTIPGNGRKCAKQIQRLKHLMKGTDGLYTFGCKRLPVFCK